MKKLLFNLYCYPAFLLVTLFALTISPFWILAGRLIPRLGPEDSFLRRGVVLYGRVLVQLVPFLAPAFVEDQTGGLPAPVIFAPNHLSSIDPYLFGAVGVEVAFVTSWAFRIPFYRRTMLRCGYLNAEHGWDDVETGGKRLLDGGTNLIIWPEGTRSRDGRMGRFKNGAFQLAWRTVTPIVPVLTVGSDILLPPGRRLLTPARVGLVLLPPLLPEAGLSEEEGILALKRKTRRTIQEEMERRGLTPDRAEETILARETNHG